MTYPQPSASMSFSNMSITPSGNSSVQVCITGMWPSTSDLAYAFSGVFNIDYLKSLFPNIDWSKFTLTLPPFPDPLIPVLNLSLPDPLFPNMHIPSMAAMYAAIQAMSIAISSAVGLLLQKLKGIGLDFEALIDSAFEAIFGYALKLSDIIAGDIAAIVAGVEKAYDKLKLIFPNPLFSGFNIKAINIVHFVTELISNYWGVAMHFIMSKISDIQNALLAIFHPLPGVPTIPTIPTLSDIYGFIYAAASALYGKTIASFEDLIAIIEGEIDNAIDSIVDKASAIRSKITNILNAALLLIFPGWPDIFPVPFTFPDIDLTFGFSFPAIDLQQKISLMVNQIWSSIVTGILKFLDKLSLGILKVTLPGLPFCMTIPLPLIEISATPNTISFPTNPSNTALA